MGALTLAACDPIWSVRGVITADAVAVAGARVSIECPFKAGSMDASGSVLSRGDGSFEMSGTGLIHERCSIAITARGLRARSYPILSVCTKTLGSPCHVADLGTVDLAK